MSVFPGRADGPDAGFRRPVLDRHGRRIYICGMRSLSSRRRVPCFLVAVAVAGCSSGAYDADYAKALASLKTRAEFSKLQDGPLELAEGRVKLWPPKSLPDLLTPEKADPRGAPQEGERKTDEAEAPPPIDPQRLRPPFLEDFPGFVCAYDAVFDSEAYKLPVTLSVGSVPTGDLREPQIAVRLADQAKKHDGFPKDGIKWESRDVVDRGGAKRPWKVLRLHGPQPIARWAGGKPAEYEPVEATCEIWLSAAADQKDCTVLVWRVPDGVKEKFSLDELAPLTARSVETVAAP